MPSDHRYPVPLLAINEIVSLLQTTPLLGELITATGFESVINPKNKNVDINFWAAVEMVGAKHSHFEPSRTIGVYEAAYWGKHHDVILNLVGKTFKDGSFMGVSPNIPGTGGNELLFGYGSSSGSDYWGLGLAQEYPVAKYNMTQNEMLGLVSGLEAMFSLGSGMRLGNFSNSSKAIGSLAGALINAGLFATWVNMTYGKK